MPQMLYMIIEDFRGDPAAVYRRFRERGRLAPDGLQYVNSWVTSDLQRCYQVMACDDRRLLDQWMAQWQDLVAFEVVPVITSAEAADAVLVGARRPKDWRGDAVEDDWVQIQNCNWLHEANVVVSVLAGDGIEAFLPDAYTLGSRPELAAALGGVRVLVRASDYDRAREVLAAGIPDLPAPGDGEHVE